MLCSVEELCVGVLVLVVCVSEGRVVALFLE